MAQYSPRNFMRQVSNDLLRRYFDARSIPMPIDWSELGETDIEPLWEAWTGLDSGVQEAADADFTDVNALATEAGRDVMIVEGGWHGLDLADEFQAFEDHHDAAMYVLLEHPEAFRVSSLLLAADRIPSRSWHRWNGLPNQKPRDDVATRESLAANLSEYFVRREGRGRHCQVDVYQRSGAFYYFAFPEDYARADQDYVAGKLIRQTHRPAFQTVFVYSPERGTLDATAPGGRPVLDKLMRLALLAMHGTDEAASKKEERIYELDRLRDQSLRWIYPVDAGIADVWLKSVRLTFRSGKDRLVLESENRTGVRTLYDRLVSSGGGTGIPPEAVYVTQAVVRVDYSSRGGRTVASRDIRLTWPNSCNLGQDKRDLVLREMLIDSGIDPAGLGRETIR